MLDFRLDTKNLERPSVIKGVRHFDNRKDAMLYASLKYGADFKKIGYPLDIRSTYVSQKYDPEIEKTLYISTPAGEWSDDHDILEVRHQWIDKDSNWHDDLVEFVTYAEGYTYAYRYEREYNFIETV